jgi:UDP-glucose 4-epimerase
VQDCDAAIVLAYRPPPDGEEAAQHERAVNLTGSARLARAAADRGAAVVFSSSAAVYGPSHDDAVAETQKATPSTPYAAAKLEAEHALAEIVGADRLVLARISTVYGPGENGPRAIPSFVRALARGERPIVHGDGLDIHDFVHVADVAAALVNAAAGAAAGDGVGVVNVGSGRGRTTLEALEAVQAALETSCEPVHVPSPRPRARLVLDIARGRERLGLEPRRDFRAAVAAEARWLVSHAHAAERA